MKQQVFRFEYLCVMMLFLATSILKAEDTSSKNWQVAVEDFEIKYCPIDSSAKAFYFFDKGYSYLHYTEKYDLYHVRHFRIKILDESALSESSFEIKLFKEDMQHSETLNTLRGKTYNLVDGEVVETSLPLRSYKINRSSNYWDIVNFTMPAVKKGSIVEVEYKIKSEFNYNIGGWNFQHEIPTIKSMYRVEIPATYVLKQFRRGNVKYTSKRYLSKGEMGNQFSSLDITNKVYEFEATNVPSFSKDNYLTTEKNYMTNLEFELTSKEFAGNDERSYEGSWYLLTKKFMLSHSFGGGLERDKVLKNAVKEWESQNLANQEKMIAALTYIKQQTEWSGIMSVAKSQSFSKTLKKVPANSADINLALVALLRKSGLNANPVILSTRENGYVDPKTPAVHKVNYIIASCEIDSIVHFMDATCDLSHVDVLPERCYNGNGFIVKKDYYKSLSIENADCQVANDFDLELNDTGLFAGTVTSNFNPYASYQVRQKVKKSKNMDSFIEEIESASLGLNIKRIDVLNVDNLDKPLVEKCKVEIVDNAKVENSTIVFTPMLYEAMKNSPLTLGERSYPIEYPYSIDNTNNFKITIPKDYNVLSMPENLTLSTEDSTHVFHYRLMENNGVISVFSRFKHTKQAVPSDKYEAVQQFYDLMVKKQKEQILLKKKV